MKLKYETGTATFVQFAVVSLFALAIQITAFVHSCFENGKQCIEDIIPNFGYFFLTALLFFGIWFLGHTAQEKRGNKWLALGLIFVEIGVFRVAYHNAKHYTDYLSLTASFLNCVLAVVVMIFALRLLRSKGGRIVHKSRARRRLKSAD